MARKKRVRLRTLVIVAIVLLLLAGLGAAFEWVYDRGLRREGLFERAYRACAEGRHAEAVRLAREALASEPGKDAAREIILESLCASKRQDEAKAEARKYLDENPDRSFAAIRLCDLALQEGNWDEAEKLAPTFNDRDPVRASRVIAMVRDFRGLLVGDWRQRLEAAALMRTIASLTENPAVRAESILQSCEVSRELLPALPQADLIEQRTQADLKEAAMAVNAAVQANKAFPYEIVMGRIRILSSDLEDAALGAKMLRPYAAGALKRDVAVMALACYHAGRGEWKEAADLAMRIEDPYLWQRLCWTIRRTDQPDQASAVLEGGPFAKTPEAALLRAEMLARSADAVRKEAGLKALAAIIEDPSSNPFQIRRALGGLAALGGAEAALASAERARLEDRREPQLTAVVAVLLTAQGSERGLELAERLATETDELAASRDLMSLLGHGGKTLDSYFEAQVGKGGDEEVRYRLYRALSLLLQAKALKGDALGVDTLKQRVRSDLAALGSNERATKSDLVDGFQMAAAIGDAELSGTLLARAFALPGARLDDMRALGVVRQLKDAETVGRLAAGVRAAAAGLPTRAFLTVLADFIEAGDAADARVTVTRLEDAAKDAASRQASLEMAGAIAFGEGDLGTAERLARTALEGDPASPVAIEIVGATLLRRGAVDDVLAFYEAIPVAQRPEGAYGHIVRAQLARGRKDDALATAREAVRRFPGAPSSSFLLAQVYRDLGDLRKALGVLSLAPSSAIVVHLRAELLRQVGDLPMAERLYQLLLSGSRFSDLVAWQGLMETHMGLKRTKEFIVLAERALGTGFLKEQPKAAAAVRYMRAQCLEADGRIDEALIDYEDAVRLDGTHWGALNNAAWYIARNVPDRIKDARAYADRAMSINPEDPSVLDTAAEVLSVQQDMAGALELVDRVVELASDAKRPSYVVHKAEILLRGEQEEAAKTLLLSVWKEHRHNPAAERARLLLWEIERKNLPEEPPEQLPAVPEEEEKRPGTGGGE